MRSMVFALGLLAGCSGTNSCPIDGETSERRGIVLYSASVASHGYEAFLVELDQPLPEDSKARQDFVATDDFRIRESKAIWRNGRTFFAKDFDVVHDAALVNSDETIEVEGVWTVTEGELVGAAEHCYSWGDADTVIEISDVKDWRVIELYPDR